MMRNYLFDRPMTEAAARQSVYTPKPPKRRRKFLPGLIVFLVLIFSISAAGLIIRYGDFSPLDVTAEGAHKGGESDAPSGSSSPEGRPSAADTTIPRAPTGDDVTLTINTGRTAALTANQVYEKALPSIVSIEAYSDEGYSTGSGIIMSEDGYVLTNYHIIEGTQSARIYLLTSSDSYEAMLVGYTEEFDLAVLKVNAQGLTPAEFGSSRILSVGDQVYALGNPLGYLYGSLTEGIISALARNIVMDGYTMSLIQTSAPLNSGNSGGALLNEYGQVVGITSAKMTSDTDVVAEGLGLAIPISDIRGCVNSIIACGRVVTPRIGILCYSSEAYGVQGILVDTVEAGPAQRAGLQAQDFITAANGIPVATVEELKDIFYDVGVGGTVELTVLRDSRELTLSMVLVE